MLNHLYELRLGRDYRVWMAEGLVAHDLEMEKLYKGLSALHDLLITLEDLAANDCSIGVVYERLFTHMKELGDTERDQLVALDTLALLMRDRKGLRPSIDQRLGKMLPEFERYRSRGLLVLRSTHMRMAGLEDKLTLTRLRDHTLFADKAQTHLVALGGVRIPEKYDQYSETIRVGDFLWTTRLNGLACYAVADCVGAKFIGRVERESWGWYATQSVECTVERALGLQHQADVVRVVN